MGLGDDVQQAVDNRRGLAEGSRTELVAGRYELLDQLGAGGMGVVHRAHDRVVDRVVALKQMRCREAGALRPKYEALFEREYHTLARLTHPGIIRVFDFGVTEAGPHYTMELLGGGDMRDLAPLPAPQACAHLRDIASSLALLHNHRLIHRDLNPRNVRLDEHGRAKLLDFGALASFGRSDSVIGTPPFVAPEVFQQAAVDQRADLFALGALGYWMLTGRNAYPARHLSELPALWTGQPVPPTVHDDSIPAELNDLILSLLSLDPHARPTTAADVIDRLTTVGNLPPLELDETVQGHLLSSELVERELERQWMVECLERVERGRGSGAVLEGSAGAGKTRLLDELSLTAQLKGVRVLRADARGAAQGGLVATSLVEAALVACPDVAREVAGPHAAQLANLSDRIAGELGVDEPAPVPEDPSERRARMQNALHGWFTAMARKTPLMFVVDDIHDADATTLALLAVLTREARRLPIVVLTSRRTNAVKQVDGSMRALLHGSERLKLRPLTGRACEQLCRSMFGQVANLGRFAKLISKRSGGNPQLVMDLAKLLIDRQLAKYVDGTWVLPQEVSDAELPARSDQILAGRLLPLGAGALELAEALCVFARGTSLARAVAVSPLPDERATYSALSELTRHEVLVNDGDTYRFAQDALRDAVHERMPEAAYGASCRRAADTLLRDAGDDIQVRVEAADLLMRAGDESRGAELLAAVGRDYTRNLSGQGQVEVVVRALHRALSVYEKQGRSEYERAEILFALAPLSFYGDFRLNLRYGERAVELGLRVTGLAMAQKLRRFLPGKLALIIALVIAGIRLKRRAAGRVGYDLRGAISMLCGCIAPTVGTRNICYDVAGVERVIDMLEPLTLFGADSVPALLRDFALGQLQLGQSREDEARITLQSVAQRLELPALKEDLGETRWKALKGGVWFSQGVLCPYWFGTGALELADRMEGLDVAVWRMGADQLRLLHHAMRGESPQVAHYMEGVERSAVQGSTTWQAEMFWPVLLLPMTYTNRDTLAARRLWEQLLRRCEDAPDLADYAEVARGAYLALRGERVRAVEVIEKVLPRIEPRKRVAWLSVPTLLATILNEESEHERALQVLREALSHVDDSYLQILGRSLEPRRQLALAEAGCGRVEEAAAILDDLIRRHGGEDQPLLLGMLHKARAEVALRAMQREPFEASLAAAREQFANTLNPSLTSQLEILAETGFRARLVERPEQGYSPVAAQMIDDFSSAMHHVKTVHDMHAYIVDLVSDRTKAQEVHLFTWRHGVMRLESSSVPQPPPPEVRQRLVDQALDAISLEELTQTEGLTDDLPVAAPSNDNSAEADAVVLDRTVLLSAQQGDRMLVVGGLVLRLDRQSLQHVDPTWFGALATSMLARRGDTSVL